MPRQSASASRKTNKCFVSVNGKEQHGFSINRNDMLLKAAVDQGINYPHNCRVGICGRCKTRLISGKVSHMVDLALSPLSNKDIKQGYFLACQGKVRGDIAIEVEIGHCNIIPEQIVSGTISYWKRLPGEVIELRIALDTPLKFQAGQYCTLSESGSFVRRSFSFYNHPPSPESVGAAEAAFLIKRLPGGEFSEWLFAADRRGTKMWLHGPYGLMGGDDGDRDGLCIAGGTGLAPILSILSQRLLGTSHSRYTLLFGVRSAKDLFAMDKLERLVAASGDRLRVIPVLSHEPENTSWQGLRGMVSDVIGDGLGVDFATVNAFVCGSLSMVEAVEQRLLDVGVLATRIHADKFSPTS